MVTEMLVKELIKKLKDFNEDNDVLIQSRYESYHFHIGKVLKKSIGKKEFIFIGEGKQEWFDKEKTNEDS